MNHNMIMSKITAGYEFIFFKYYSLLLPPNTSDSNAEKRVGGGRREMVGHIYGANIEIPGK